MAELSREEQIAADYRTDMIVRDCLAKRPIVHDAMEHRWLIATLRCLDCDRRLLEFFDTPGGFSCCRTFSHGEQTKP